MTVGNEELVHECFPKQQEWNKTKKQTKKVRREAWVQTPITTLSKYNNNKHNMVVFYMEKLQWNSINKKQNGLQHAPALNWNLYIAAVVLWT